MVQDDTSCSKHCRSELLPPRTHSMGTWCRYSEGCVWHTLGCWIHTLGDIPLHGYPLCNKKTISFERRRDFAEKNWKTQRISRPNWQVGISYWIVWKRKKIQKHYKIRLRLIYPSKIEKFPITYVTMKFDYILSSLKNLSTALTAS